jgi:hypothetical protein
MKSIWEKYFLPFLDVERLQFYINEDYSLKLISMLLVINIEIGQRKVYSEHKTNIKYEVTQFGAFMVRN